MMASYKDRSKILWLIGIALVLVGLTGAFLGPAEMITFYWFGVGGRFSYPGFGFGSFMLAFIAWQIIVYYLIGLVGIPLGIGHLLRRRWARTVLVVLLRGWLVFGVPVSLVILFTLFASKDTNIIVGVFAITAAVVSYPLLPWLVLRFYQSDDVRLTFEAKDPEPHWIEKIPIPVLTLAGVLSFYVLMLHAPLFFNGLFPVFSAWLTGRTGIIVLDVFIWLLVLLTWGIWRRHLWAWWGAVIYFGLLTLSTLVTLFTTRFQDTLSLMNFPQTEYEIFQGMPVQNSWLAAIVGIPLLITLGVILFSRKSFVVS
jgi:hypothetical protein